MIRVQFDSIIVLLVPILNIILPGSLNSGNVEQKSYNTLRGLKNL